MDTIMCFAIVREGMVNSVPSLWTLTHRYDSMAQQYLGLYEVSHEG